METLSPTPTPTAVERYTNIRERMCARLEAEGARYSVARAVDLLILELLTWMISWAVARAERLAQEEVGADGAEAAAAVGGDSGVDRRGATERPDVARRTVVRAVVAPAVWVRRKKIALEMKAVCAWGIRDSRESNSTWPRRREVCLVWDA